MLLGGSSFWLCSAVKADAAIALPPEPVLPSCTICQPCLRAVCPPCNNLGCPVPLLRLPPPVGMPVPSPPPISPRDYTDCPPPPPKTPLPTVTPTPPPSPGDDTECPPPPAHHPKGHLEGKLRKMPEVPSII